jgi:flagellar M-ring protein FliF
VAQNLPQEAKGSDGGENSSASNDRREETTNYELSSKTVNTVSDGFSLQSLSVAVLVNRARIAGEKGDAKPDEVDKKLEEIQQIVSTAADYRADRGDQIKVVAVDFAPASEELTPVPPVGMMELVVRQLGTFVNAATILIVTFLVIWFGLKPAVKTILAKPPAPSFPAVAANAGTMEAEQEPQVSHSPEASLIEDLTSQMKRSPRKRLEQMVRYSDEQSAAILKQWIHQGART